MPRYKNMRLYLLPLLALFLLPACREKIRVPDVSGVEMKVDVARFDQSFFEIDTNVLFNDMVRLQQGYPQFYPDFMQEVLGLPPFDTSTDVRNNLIFFYQGYRPLYDSLLKTYAQTTDIQAAVEQGMRYARYYFPDFPAKQKLIFFVGPFDAPGAALTREGIAIGLHLYAGADFSFYQSPQGTELYPTYISRRFERAYIPVNALKLVVQELCPDTIGFGPLIEQMIRRGREAWLLDQFLPRTADSLKLGYTDNQLSWCEANESLIWSYFLKNIDPQTTDPDILQNFLGEGPFTAGLDQERSPGNLGTWIGRQIVRAYLKKFPNTTARELARIPADKILDGAAYKPR